MSKYVNIEYATSDRGIFANNTQEFTDKEVMSYAWMEYNEVEWQDDQRFLVNSFALFARVEREAVGVITTTLYGSSYGDTTVIIAYAVAP